MGTCSSSSLKYVVCSHTIGVHDCGHVGSDVASSSEVDHGIHALKGITQGFKVISSPNIQCNIYHTDIGAVLGNIADRHGQVYPNDLCPLCQSSSSGDTPNQAGHPSDRHTEAHFLQLKR